MRVCTFILLLFSLQPISGQLKFLVEDFEGFENGGSDLRKNGLYTYGKFNAEVDSRNVTGSTYSGAKCVRVDKTGKIEYGGWGKGITMFVNLDFSKDYFNFYFFQPSSNSSSTLQISIQDDDNEDNQFTPERDDQWTYTVVSSVKNKWELISVPLSHFKDISPGGDGGFNISYLQGKLLGVMISFPNSLLLKDKESWYFDFMCFSKGKLPTGANLFEPPVAQAGDFCALGAWSHGEGQAANFVEIARTFEENFNNDGKKIGIVHFFQPFGKDDGASSLYPSSERINKVIEAGYIPMITLENHFVSNGKKGNQPNLYSITEGHFDSFLGYWAHLIKDVKGTVLLRILHEFNGDWYDWCTVKNDRNPELVARAFRYIHNIFNENNVHNVKFIWCPNSMSIPQEKWNDIMYAYPGDAYVDFVALDVYNGAGSSQVWRSFRKEGIENYFVLTEKLPHKPLLICETASRERRVGETGQNKGEWIKEQSIALKTDMSKIRLMTWFNQTETFKLNSSRESKEAYVRYILNDPFFRKGITDFESLLK